MTNRTDSLDIKVLAQVEGLDDVRQVIEEAMKALEQVQNSLANVTITMDVEEIE